MLFISLKCYLFVSKRFLNCVLFSNTVLVTVEETKGKRTSSVFLQDGDGQSVWELVGAPMEGNVEWEGMEKVRMGS